MKTITALLAFSLCWTLPAAAIELSLEENKAERGNIGYIDMQRLFKTFPDTLRARENFEELVRQAEEQLNLRKAELLRLRHDLSELRIQRDFMAKTPIEVPKARPAEAPKPAPQNPELSRLLEGGRQAQPAAPPQSPAQPAAPETAPAPAPAPAPAADSGRRQREPETDLTRPSLANLPGFSVAQSTSAEPPAEADENAREAADQARKAAEAKRREPLVINIPGVSTAPIVVQPPQQAAPEPPAVAASTGSAPAAQPAAQAAEKPEEPANPALIELEIKIAAKAKELSAKELEFKEQQAAAEKNLLDTENRKTEALLGKIHRAVQEIARREGVSVVVDKNSILYGHDAVDLTDKVMKHLKGS